jgi:hypothetical protein
MLCGAYPWKVFAVAQIVGYGVVVTLALVQRNWLMRVAAEGREAHAWVSQGLKVIIVMAMIGPMLGGLSRWFVATRGQESAIQILGPSLLTVLWVFSALIAVFGFLLFLIGRVQYLAWRNPRDTAS